MTDRIKTLGDPMNETGFDKAESSPEKPHVFPVRAIMFVECARCRKELRTVPVSHDDPANGLVSHGLCESCASGVWQEFKEYLQKVR